MPYTEVRYSPLHYLLLIIVIKLHMSIHLEICNCIKLPQFVLLILGHRAQLAKHLRMHNVTVIIHLGLSKFTSSLCILTASSEASEDVTAIEC